MTWIAGMLLCRVDGSPGVTLCSKTCCEIVWGSALGGHGCLAVYSFLGSVQLIDGGQVESAAAMVKDCAEWAKRSPFNTLSRVPAQLLESARPQEGIRRPAEGLRQRCRGGRCHAG